MIRFLLVVVVLVLGGAFVTKPSEDRVREVLGGKLREAIQARELDQTSDLGGVAATALCKLDTSACVELILRGIELDYEDQYIAARVGLSGFGRQAICWAAFTTLLCPEDPLR